MLAASGGQFDSRLVVAICSVGLNCPKSEGVPVDGKSLHKVPFAKQTLCIDMPSISFMFLNFFALRESS